MKTAKELGYKVGDVFVYNIDATGLNSEFHLEGALTLVEDDGTSCPLFRQGDIEAYEDLDLLRKIEDKPLNYADFVGKSLTVKGDGYGFPIEEIGRICKIEAYSDNGYGDEKGFKVEGYDNSGYGFVGVESFFPDGLVDDLTEDALGEYCEQQRGDEMSGCKNAEYYGYKVGDKFEYVPQAKGANGKFDRNDVLTFVFDDGSHCPRFENQNKIVGYEYLDLLEKLEEVDSPQEGQHEVTETVTICPSAALQEMLLACFSDEISVEISMDRVTVNWQGLAFVADKEVGLEQVLKAVDLLSQQQVGA